MKAQPAQPTADAKKLPPALLSPFGAASNALASELRETERARQQSEDRYRRLVEHAPVAIVVHRDGRFVYVNQAAIRLWGASSVKDLVGREVIELVHPDCRESVRNRIAIVVNEGVPTPVSEQKLLRLDGASVEVEVAGTVCMYDGQPSVQAILRDITRRKRAEEVARKAHEELETRVRQRTAELSRANADLEAEIVERRTVEGQLQQERVFLRQLLKAHESDRQLIAYEIHDTFVQDIVAAMMFLDAFAAKQSATGALESADLQRARQLLQKSIDTARRLISGLRPPIIDEQGIVASIDYLINEPCASGPAISFRHQLASPRLPSLLEASVFRIVQEGLANMRRHSLAEAGEIVLIQQGSTLHVEIRDWGVGFDPDQIPEGHFGLQGIKERAYMLGGTATIHSHLGQGTQIIVEVPIA